MRLRNSETRIIHVPGNLRREPVYTEYVLQIMLCIGVVVQPLMHRTISKGPN